jgi:ribosomal protein L11 methylase PrmA
LKHYGWALALGMTFAFAGAGSPTTSRAAASESTPAASTSAVTTAAATLMAFGQAQAPLREPDVIYVPTPDYVVEAMLKMANVTATDVVYDLGSGDGRIPITAAQKYGARAVGIDINPQRIKEANENLAKAGVGDKVKFLNQDLFETDLSPATVITLYLLPSLNQKLMPKLKALKPGTRIVSHSFDMGTAWPPEKTEDVRGRVIYYWTIK